jgi:hypothetical protein
MGLREVLLETQSLKETQTPSRQQLLSQILLLEIGLML